MSLKSQSWKIHKLKSIWSSAARSHSVHLSFYMKCSGEAGKVLDCGWVGWLERPIITTWLIDSHTYWSIEQIWWELKALNKRNEEKMNDWMWVLNKWVTYRLMRVVRTEDLWVPLILCCHLLSFHHQFMSQQTFTLILFCFYYLFVPSLKENMFKL